MLEQFLDVGIFHPSKIIEWYINHFWHCSNHAQYLPTDGNEHYIGFTSTNISITRIPRIVCVTSATHRHQLDSILTRKHSSVVDVTYLCHSQIFFRAKSQ
jgi:hypothetical protein